MSLPALQWRKLPPRNLSYVTGSVTPSILLNVIYDMITGSVYHDGATRLMGSGSAWQTPFKFVTGSNTEAICLFPPTVTSVSQSVIFSGISRTATVSSSAIPATASFDGAFTSSILYVANVKNATSESFTQWTSRYPFGSSSFSTGYAKFKGVESLTNTNISVNIYESKEAIAAMVYDYTNTINQAVVAGAIIDPEQTTTSVDAEIDNRLYGIITNGENGSGNGSISATMFQQTGGGAPAASQQYTMFSNNNTSTTSGNRFIIFAPQSSSYYNNVGARKPIAWYQYTTMNTKKIVDVPMHCIDFKSANVNLTDYTSNYAYVGRLREMTFTSKLPANAVIKDASGNTVGYSLSSSEITYNDAVLFKN